MAIPVPTSEPQRNAEWMRFFMAVSDTSNLGFFMPEDYGAAGDGTKDDTDAIKATASALRSQGHGVLYLSPGATYYVLSDGGTLGDSLIDLEDCSGVVIEGNGATILTGEVEDVQDCILLNNTDDVIIRNLNFVSGYQELDYDDGIDWIKAIWGSKRIFLQNINALYGRIFFAATGAANSTGSDSDRVDSITAFNCNLHTVYYGFNFQASGDNFFARNIIATNCGRSYFPWNVKNHDVWVSSTPGGEFSDVLMKVYSTTDFYSRLENIKLNYHSTGRYSGSGNAGSGTACVQIDAHRWASNPTGARFHDIDITFQVEAPFTDKQQSLFNIYKWDENGVIDTTGTRGHQFTNIKLRGSALSAQNFLSDAVIFFGSSYGTWTGEFAGNVWIEDMIISNTASDASITFDGTPINVVPCGIRNVQSTGDLTLSNVAGKSFTVEQSNFDNFVSTNCLSTLERVYQPTTPQEGQFVIWMSNGGGHGDDGDVMIASTAGGTTNYATLFDHSAGTSY